MEEDKKLPTRADLLMRKCENIAEPEDTRFTETVKIKAVAIVPKGNTCNKCTFLSIYNTQHPLGEQPSWRCGLFNVLVLSDIGEHWSCTHIYKCDECQNSEI